MQELFPQKEKIETNAQILLKSLELRKPIENPSEVAIVVAHQDDESIGFCSSILRMPNCLVVHVTDGAPEDEKYWKGVETRDQYAQVREYELNLALRRAKHKGERISLELKDQEAALRLVENARTLSDLLEKKGIKVVMTHAYEGGHPDHDAVTFAVHAAKELMKRRGHELDIIEAPLYRPINGELVYQNFIPAKESQTFELRLTPDEMYYKSMTYDAHRSQKEVFSAPSENETMSTERELLREALRYDFAKLPNDGNLSQIYTAGLKEKWQTLISHALKELGLEGKF